MQRYDIIKRKGKRKMIWDFEQRVTLLKLLRECGIKTAEFTDSTGSYFLNVDTGEFENDRTPFAHDWETLTVA